MRSAAHPLAKQTGITVILVGHVTKEGALAGPRVLEHIVDTVLYFEGDTHSSFRLIRAVKNRYGAVNEIGVFAMTDKGLKGVSNPSAIFLSQHGSDVPGSCVLVTQEGTRPLLVEIQALVDQAHGNPRRLTVGLDAQPSGDAAGGPAPPRRNRAASIRTCSSMPSAASRSANPRPTSRYCLAIVSST
jgi:predicted ATP-dependent serine protease